MSHEIVANVEATEKNDLLLRLKSGGSPSYQYIYRGAVGVYWDNENGCFKFSGSKDWPYSKCVSHIVNVVKSELGVDLAFDKYTTWTNVSAGDKNEILLSLDSVLNAQIKSQ